MPGNDYQIAAIKVSEHIPVADELMQLLHDSERGMNPHTAQWENIRDHYLQHVITCQEACEGLFLIAKNGDEVIGFIFGYIDEPDESDFEGGEGDDLYISEGFVKEAYRRQGVYAALNAALEAHYKDYNIRRIYRYTLCNNEKMQQWLATQGYQPVRMVYEKWIKK